MHGNRQKLWFAVCGTSQGLVLAIAGAWAQSTAPNAPAAPAGPKRPGRVRLSRKQYSDQRCLTVAR